jgi:CRP/FNR family transcriptional regulator, cyclic AMP receptor protein
MATFTLPMGQIGIWTSRTYEFELPPYGKMPVNRDMNEGEEKRIAPERAQLEKEVAAHPFLLGMGDRHVRLLADCAMRSHFHAREVIFREGEVANRFYLIVRGEVGLESSTLGEPIRIEEIRDGDLLGWSWLFPPYAWHFTARALEETNAIFFYGTILREYCEKDHSLGFELFKRMSVVMLRRLQAARQKLLSARQTGTR